jgi:hypothetical protein
MTITQQFDAEWSKLSGLKNPITRETALYFYRLGSMAPVNYRQEFEREWIRLSPLKNPIRKETALFFFQLGALYCEV